MKRPDIPAALSEVRAVYADLEKRPLERNCTLVTECCQFKLTKIVPMLTRGEAVLAAKAWRAAGRTTLPEPADGSCPFLDPRTSRCAIYQDRPFACRTHFCEGAGGPYDRKHVIDLIRRLEDVDIALSGVGAQRLVPAVTGALKNLLNK